MACVSTDRYWIKFEAIGPWGIFYPYSDFPTNTIPNIKTFEDWALALFMTETDFCTFITTFPTLFELVGPSGGPVFGPPATVIGNVMLWADGIGQLASDGGTLATVALTGDYTDLSNQPFTYDGNPLHFLDGTGNFSTPAGGGGAITWLSQGILDMTELYAVVPKSFATMNNLDICGVSCPGFPGGMAIGDFQTTFPDCYHMLKVDLGWSNADILARTYFSAAYVDASLRGYLAGAGFAFNRWPIRIPSGKHWYNMELRMPQGITSCQGAQEYFGGGGTQIIRTATNWKSLYGAQNNNTFLGLCPYNYAGESGTSVAPLSVGGGYEYCHGTQIRDCCMTGTSGPSGFNDNTYRECSYMYWNGGENSGDFNCLYTEHNDVGKMITGFPAYANSAGCSFFRNKVAGTGVRGGALSTINLSHSGDFNPFSFIVFRQGDSTTTVNGAAYWPCFLDVAPGGEITLDFVKIESWACRSGYHSYTACTPDIIGKGQMMCQISGRFHLLVKGGGGNVHEGAVNTLVRVIDDYFDTGGGVTGIPLDNSSVCLLGLGLYRYAYFLHYVHGNKKFTSNAAGTFTQSNNFYWQANIGSGLTARDPMNGTAITVVAATFTGIQPFVNDGNPLTWNESTGPSAGEGYDCVQGFNW